MEYTVELNRAFAEILRRQPETRHQDLGRPTLVRWAAASPAAGREAYIAGKWRQVTPEDVHLFASLPQGVFMNPSAAHLQDFGVQG